MAEDSSFHTATLLPPNLPVNAFGLTLSLTPIFCTFYATACRRTPND
ncbi:hypothetical protein D3OALGA1CA_3358 [Olavius algarvensis associated proteobacterium Delta 3]|nr:hypothetical protein D3OALGB2SA_3118 [Olavius algarvensis associated proteobacterium Delta 3]CAB5133115.1 hypothetical protein D3OALGA1CA_3358 [Olavius algarvensis associated proteobacterium Delta 3]